MRKVLVVSCLVCSTASASSLRNEIAVSRANASPSTPRSGAVSDAFDASFDLDPKWTLDAGAMLTLQSPTAASERGGFGGTGAAVPLFTGGVDFAPDDHFTFGLSFDYSPATTQYSGTDITLTTVNDPALIRSRTAESAGGFEIGYDTAGDSDLELAFTAGLTATNITTTQQIVRVRTASGTANDAAVVTYCKTHACPRGLLAALQNTEASLNSQRLSASAVATAWADTDFGLTADYWHYNVDPTQVGYFSIASAGRTAAPAGAGVPIAPLHWTLRPEVAHRFGDFSARAFVQFGRYVQGGGEGTGSIGLKLQYKLSKTLRAWITGSGQSDTDNQGQVSISTSLALGAGYRF